MALLGSGSFKASEAPEAGFPLLPPDIYIAQIVSSEIKPTKSGTGEYISVRYKILDGEFEGNSVFGMFNIVNDSEQAQKIGQAQLGQLCKAVGVEDLEDTQQLHGIPMRITVGIQEGTGGYEDKNYVKKHAPMNEGCDDVGDDVADFSSW